MVVDEEYRQLLTTGANKLADAAKQKQDFANHSYLGVNHWLIALLERHAAMAEALAVGFLAEEVKHHIEEQLEKGKPGAELDYRKAIESAAILASQRDRIQASERDLAAIILDAAGYKLITDHAFHQDFQSKTASKTRPSETGNGTESVATISALKQFGRDITQDARDGKLNLVVGREEETDLLIETLCRRTKRNPVLVGPAGVGKTAIVEGLAVRIQSGSVPAILTNARIIALQPSVLVAGAYMAGELEKRMKAVLLEASQDGVLLFIDEIHTIMGTGGVLGTSDLGSMLKPALARGDIACIAATTDDEYRRFIESDTALERRFQPIRIHELSAEQTLNLLRVLRNDLSKANQVEIGNEVLDWLVEFAQRFMRNRYFPDKAVDLLEQCYAHALAKGKKSVDIADAKEVAQRMVGMPVVSTERLILLEKELLDRRFLTESEAQLLIGRLQVTLRGLDMRASRPNAVVLLTGDALENTSAFAETIAEHLYGSADRVIIIDCSRFVNPEDITLLVGAPPGYVGYSDRLALHRLAQIPWCVLLFEHIDTCHPLIRELLAQAFQDGWILDGKGKTLYLSDAIVMMTCEINLQSHRNLGFTTDVEKISANTLYQEVTRRIGVELANGIDLITFGTATSRGVSYEWLKDHFLNDLCSRYHKQGVDITWDVTFLEWLEKQESNQLGEHDWELWVDRVLTPLIIPLLPADNSPSMTGVLVNVEDDQVHVFQKGLSK